MKLLSEEHEKTGIVGRKIGLLKCIGTIDSDSSIFGHRLQCVFPLEKNILYCFASRKYSEFSVVYCAPFAPSI